MLNGILSREDAEPNTEVGENNVVENNIAENIVLEESTKRINNEIDKVIEKIDTAKVVAKQLENKIKKEEHIDSEKLTTELVEVSIESLNNSIVMLGGEPNTYVVSNEDDATPQEQLRLSIEGAKSILGIIASKIHSSYKKITTKLEELFTTYTDNQSELLYRLKETEDILRNSSDEPKSRLTENTAMRTAVHPFSTYLVGKGMKGLPSDTSGMFDEILKDSLNTDFIKSDITTFKNIISEIETLDTDITPKNLISVIDRFKDNLINRSTLNKEFTKSLLEKSDVLEYPIKHDTSLTTFTDIFACYGFNVYYTIISYDTDAYNAVKKMGDDVDVKIMKKLINSFNIEYRGNEISDRKYNNLMIEQPTKKGLLNSINVIRKYAVMIKGLASVAKKNNIEYDKILTNAITIDPEGEVSLVLLKKIISLGMGVYTNRPHRNFQTAITNVTNATIYVYSAGHVMYGTK